MFFLTILLMATKRRRIAVNVPGSQVGTFCLLALEIQYYMRPQAGFSDFPPPYFLHIIKGSMKFSAISGAC